MDDKSKKGPQDSSRINVNEDYELSYWTEKFGISSDELKTLVQKGTSADTVEEYLESRKP